MELDGIRVVTPGTKSCHRCGGSFTCGVAQQKGACWCHVYPAVLQPDNQQDCYCEDCLGSVISTRINTFIDATPLQNALEVAHDFRGNDTLLKDIDYTVEQGNYVFSRWYHLKRGACCGNGCKNCPFIER